MSRWHSHYPIGTQFTSQEITTSTLDLAKWFPNLKSVSTNKPFNPLAASVIRITFPPCFTTLRESNFPNKTTLTIIFGNENAGSGLVQVGWNAIPNYQTVVLYRTEPITSTNFNPRKLYVPDASVNAWKEARPAMASRIYPISEWEG